MAVIAFWSQEEKVTNQTTSLLVSAIQMAIEKNYKILIIDANFNSNSMRDALFASRKASVFDKQLNLGKVDISSGAEGLVQAVSTNRISPEIIKNFTKPVFAQRLDFLGTFRTNERAEYERVAKYYVEILSEANKFYDLVYIDIEKGLDNEITKSILEKADIIVVCFEQIMKDIEGFRKLWGINELLPKQKTIPLLTKEDKFSKYNSDNVARYIGQKWRRGICSIVYNTILMEKMQEGDIANFLIKTKLSGNNGRNQYLIDTINDLNFLIVDILQGGVKF